MTPPSAPLDEALESLLAGGRLVDLSLTLDEALPCWWPTHIPFQQKTYTWFADRDDPATPLRNRTGAAYQTRWLLMDEHTGTHCDAPSHFVPPPGSGLPHAGPGGETGVDNLPLNQLMGRAAVVDVTQLTETGSPGESPRIGPQHLVQFEREHGALAAGEIVLLRGDWDGRYRPGSAGAAYSHDALITASAPGWPAPTAEAVELLLERGVRCLGTDGVSIGAADSGEGAHVAGLTRGMAFVEALANLRELPPRGAYFIFLPIKLAHGTGGPGRAIAVVPDGT